MKNLCFIQKTRIIDRNRFDLYVNTMTHVLSLKYSTTWLVGSNFIWKVIWIWPLIYGMLVNVSVSTRNKIANIFYFVNICISLTVKYNNNQPDSTVLNLVKLTICWNCVSRYNKTWWYLPFVTPATKTLIIWFSNLLILSVPDDGYYRKMLCTLNLISMFLFIW